jgi:hypothetical protein
MLIFLFYECKVYSSKIRFLSANLQEIVRFQVSTAVTMKNDVSLDVTPCDLIRTCVSEERCASIISMTRIGELGTMLAVTNFAAWFGC